MLINDLNIVFVINLLCEIHPTPNVLNKNELACMTKYRFAFKITNLELYFNLKLGYQFFNSLIIG